MLRRLFFAGLGVFAFLLALELLLRLLPVSSATMSGYYADPKVLNYPPGHRWTLSSGWDLRNSHRLQANNLGFASSRDFLPDIQAIALVGDSYVEASMLDEAQRPAAQLEAWLAETGGPHRPVYGLGGPGSALLDYAERIRLASERLGVRDFVVLMEPGDLRQSLCGSGNVHAPCLDSDSLQPRLETQAPPSAAKRALRHSALAQYVFSQLKVDLARLPAQAFSSSVGAAHAGSPKDRDAVDPPNEAADVVAARERMVRAVTDTFFERVRPYLRGRLVIVVDGRRERDALAAGSASLTPILRERELFLKEARQRGALVVDGEPIYRRHAEVSTLSLDVGPYDHHLNPLGVSLLMQAAAEALR